MRRPILRPNYAKQQPSAASKRAQAVAMIFSRLDRGLPLTPDMLGPFGIKPAEAARMIADAQSRKLL